MGARATILMIPKIFRNRRKEATVRRRTREEYSRLCREREAMWRELAKEVQPSAKEWMLARAVEAAKIAIEIEEGIDYD